MANLYFIFYGQYIKGHTFYSPVQVHYAALQAQSTKKKKKSAHIHPGYVGIIMEPTPAPLMQR